MFTVALVIDEENHDDEEKMPCILYLQNMQRYRDGIASYSVRLYMYVAIAS